MMDGARTQSLRWIDVYQLADRLARKLLPNAGLGRQVAVWGVPRGGVHVAMALDAVRPGRFVLAESPEEADVLVDDIVDSGATRGRVTERYPGKPFEALVEKDPNDLGLWVVFPWETDERAPAEENARRLLQSLGAPLDAEGTAETPGRWARSLAELTEGYRADPAEILSTTFEAAYDEMVVVRDIGFWSLCEHHVLPFHGTVTVGYLPRGRVVGLSKLARLVHAFSRRLQIQERLTQQVAHAVEEHLAPLGVGCVVRASHLCMAMRGVRTPAEMVTSTLLGRFRLPEVRAEFLGLAGKS